MIVKVLEHLWELFFFIIRIFLFESFYPTRCINNLLLSCHKRMTMGTNFHFDVLFG